MKEYIVNYTNIEEGIPKIIHQMWIGPHKMPTRYINTWRYDYIKENPDWKYMFWTEKEIEDFNLVNKDIYDLETQYSGKSDIARYEILNRHGGIWIDADSVWLNNKSLNPLIENSKNEKMFGAIETNLTWLANTIIGSTPNNENMQFLIDEISNMRGNYLNLRKKKMVWELTGPLLFDKIRTTNRPIKIFPTNYFYPRHWQGKQDLDNHKKLDLPKESYMYHYGITTNNLFNEY